MKKEDIKVCILGVGNMGKAAVATMLEQRMALVGAVDRDEKLIGKDLACLIGKKEIGVPVERDLASVLERTKPDVVFISTETEMDKVYDYFLICAKHKCNVVTISEDLYYPWVNYPEQSKNLEKIFKENGVTLFASGIQDVFFSALPITLASTCKKVDSFELKQTLPLEDMGKIVVEEFYLGKTEDEYRKKTKGRNPVDDPSVQGVVIPIYANCKTLGLEVVQVECSIDPLLAPQDILMPQWDMVIKKGTIVGQDFIANVKSRAIDTGQEVMWYTCTKIKVIEKGVDQLSTEWFVKGEPNLHLTLDDVCGEVTTSSTTVNRIPMVIAADAGVKTVADLPNGRYSF